QYVWARDQHHLLGRLYASQGMAPERPIRCLLLARSFSHAFLRCLSLVSVPVSPYLVRRLPTPRERGILILPAASIFGPDEEDHVAGRRSAAPADAPTVAAEQALGAPARRAQTTGEPETLMPAAATHEAARADDGEPPYAEVLEPGDLTHLDALVGAEALSDPDSLPELPALGSATGDPIENLTAEELDEFERFDRQRRERGRRSS
ncbi:MAG TPA: hypothetical protein VFT43_15610, partial [Candidatus Polarisedimenticolia bacterium]|nr:hypothetical protein [Candidatus Polarisedimenticolia bacterium]